MARSALERSIPFESAVRSFSEQLEDQNRQVELLKTALQQLESKLEESRSQADILTARYRRARTAQRAAAASSSGEPLNSNLSRVSSGVMETEAQAYGTQALLDTDTTSRIEALDKADKVERLLANLRARITE